MTYQEKAYALERLAEISIRIRKMGDWYVHQSVEIKKGGVLVGEYGNGETPEFAIEDHWDKLTNLKHDEYLVTGAFRETRKAVRWNGFMWDTVIEEKAA